MPVDPHASAVPPSLDPAPPCSEVTPVTRAATLATSDATTQQVAESPSLPVIPGYEVLEELGRGGMGVVYKARQLNPPRTVALKMILASRHASTEERLRFQIEAEAVARLIHPNIVQLHELGQHDGLPFFSLEFCDGGSLDAKLKSWTPTPTEAADLAQTLARAIHFAHLRGVVHRDLKPGNILLQNPKSQIRNPNADRSQPRGAGTGAVPVWDFGFGISDLTPKITDFGLAKRLDSGSDVSKSGAVMGTPNYMAPEQAAGRVRDTGPAADVYALGAILYELLCGQPPFRGETAADTIRQVIGEEPVPPGQRRPGVPRDLETICLKALQKDPARRYGSAEELADDLRRWHNREPITARPVGRAERVLKWVRRKPAAAALIAVSALAAIALLTGGLVYNYNLQLAYQEVEQTQQAVNQANEQANAFRKASQQVYDDARALQAGARQDKSAAEKALRESRQILYGLQLREIKEAVAARQFNQGLALLEDTDRCPPTLRTFPWHHYHRWCKRDRQTLSVGRGLSLAVSPDSRLLAVGGDGGVRLYDLAGGQVPVTLNKDGAGYTTVAFSPDGRTLAAPGGAGALLWDLATRQVKEIVNKDSASFDVLAFSHDGKTLAGGTSTLGRPGTVRLWDVQSGKVLQTHTGNADAILSLAFASNGKYLAAGLASGEARLWDLAGPPEGVRMRVDPLAHVKSVAFSPDGKTLATGCADGLVKLWNVDDRQCRRELQGYAAGVNGVAFLNDSTVVAGYDNACVKVWDIVTATELNTFLGHQTRVRTVACAPDGRTVVSRSDDGVVKLWNSDLACAPTTVAGARGHCLAVVDARTIAFVAEDRSIPLWDVVSGKARTVLPGTARWTTALAGDPAGKLLAGGSSDGTLLLWDLASGTLTKTWTGHGKEVNGLAFSPDGATLATAGRDRLLKLWDVRTGNCTATLAEHDAEVRAVAFARDGKSMASCGWDGALRLWNPLTAQPRETCKEFKGYLYSVAYHPDGQTVATAGDGKVINLWDARTATKRAVLAGHEGPVRCLAYSPDGQTLASAGLDHTILLWDTATLKQVAVLHGHKGPIAALGFTPDGKHLASVSADKTLKLWPAGPAR